MGYRKHILELAHEHPWSGHLGVNKKEQLCPKTFLLAGMKTDVVQFCDTCHTCQVVVKPNQLLYIPLLHGGEPFEHAIADCMGSLPRTKAGNQFLLTILEAILLRKVSASAITKASIKFFTTFRFII